MNAEKLSGKVIFLELCAVLAGVFTATAQSAGNRTARRQLTMNQTIMLAQEQSIASMVNENIYAAAAWNHRSYKASRLPSLNLQAGIANITRAISRVPNADGTMSYPYVFQLSNDAGLSLRQNISATGGTLSLSSTLQRDDQFKPHGITYISRPITLSYVQPLFGYNSFKWDKRIRPQSYERAKLEYLEAMEGVTIQAAGYFWGLAMAELNRDIAMANYENSKQLYRIAEERYKIGAIPRDQVLQMELTKLNDSLSINTRQIEYIEHKNRLASFIGLREDADMELLIDYALPGITLDYDMVLAAALKNSSFELDQEIGRLEAERSIAQAKANRGINVEFNATFGLEQSGDTFRKAYHDPRDQEVAGFSVQIPILDWGVGRGRVKMAQSTAERVRYEHEQALIDYRQSILVRVMAFNAQQAQCDGALRAKNIADERFALSVENFTRGTLSVTELNTAQAAKDDAQRNYILNLTDYWDSYFDLRRISLYDYISRTDIGAAFGDEEFDKLME